MICKNCKERIYFTGNLFQKLEYCGRECFEASYEFSLLMHRLNSFWNTLDDEQRHYLHILLDGGIFESPVWKQYIGKIITNEKLSS